ncbi:MAG: energy transducer TonB [Opitutales bacterium]|nr:energy transducer TonB [Opitutales bacterium]
MNDTLDSVRPNQNMKGIILLCGGVAAVALFIAIPLIQAISTGLKDPNKITDTSFALPPPPVLEIEAPPPPKQEEEQEEIEIDKEPPKLSLEQLEMALNPGTGDIAGSINLDLSIDANSLGTEDLIFDIEDVEEKPRALRQVPPVYPAVLQRKKVQGVVYLVFVIDDKGTVMVPRVERSTHPEFEKPAVDAIKRWKFSPGKRAGQPVKVRVRLPLQFVP